MSEAEECLDLAKRTGEILSKYLSNMNPGDIKACEAIFKRVKEIGDEQNKRTD